MKITVLCGGLSHEREVSLSSGSLIAAALVRRGYEVCLVDIYTGATPKGVYPLPPATPTFRRDPVVPYRVDAAIPDLDALICQTGRGTARLHPCVLPLCAEADAVFIALHGDVGENGQVQALLDMENIPYTGSDYVGSLLAMDKDLSKQLLTHAGIPTPPWVHVPLSAKAQEITILSIADTLETAIGYPMVIKPTAGGSSVGISMPERRDELIHALREAARYEPTLMAEKRIVGRELTVSILGDQVLPAVEIIPKSGFYDYENKYQPGLTDEICPAPLTERQAELLRKTSLAAFRTLRLRGYARFDYILDEQDTPWCLEANTLPGMTPTSLLPKAAAAVGMTYDELCDRMIQLALGDLVI